MILGRICDSDMSPSADRMPVPIGQFISHNVYNNLLKNIHSITTTKSCVFVDVATGKEEHQGFSWKVKISAVSTVTYSLPTRQNRREIQVAMRLAKKYHDLGKSYRIVTPYDAQRSELESALEREKLPWADRCFNVDSFQGITLNIYVE
jgi:AAA domain